MPTIEWNVKNARNVDVERQHLNKILADIRTSVDDVYSKLGSSSSSGLNVQDIVGAMVSNNTERGLSVTYNSATKKLDFQTNNFNITLQGDVTGEGTVTNLGSVTINTELAPGTYLEDAPNDQFVYWRGQQQWQPVPQALLNFSYLTDPGIVVRDNDGFYVAREIEVADTSRLTITDGNGVEANPVLDLAAVTPTTGGSILRLAFDGYGRRVQEGTATTDDLPEGTTNLYFTDTRSYDSIKSVLVAGTNVTLTPDDVAETITIASAGGTGGQVDTIVAGTGILVDSTDPVNPVVTATGLRVPAYLQNGTASHIPLNANSQIPALLANGTASNIQVIL